MNQNYPQELNLPPLSPYPLVASNTRNGLVYSFKTQAGITYRMLFEPDSDYVADYPFSNSVFSFSINSETGEVGKRDGRIKLTISHALTLVFEANPDIIITYICSRANDQERHRRILFGQWFQEYGEGFCRIDYTDKDRIYSAAIFKEDHSYKFLIEEAFYGIYADK